MSSIPSATDVKRSLEQRHRWRMAKDQIARYGVAVGGVGVIVAILLIFFYLFYVVFPLFLPASAKPVAEYALPGGSETRTLQLDIDEQSEMAVRYTDDGRAVFFHLADGSIVEETKLPGVQGKVHGMARGGVGSGMVALALDDGQVLIVQHKFKVSYPNDVRTITPALEYPLGEALIEVGDKGMVLQQLAFRDSEERLFFAAVTAQGRALITWFDKTTSFLDDSVKLERHSAALDLAGLKPAFLLVEPGLRHLYLADVRGELLHFDISEPEQVNLVERVRVTAKDSELTSLRFLTGGISLLAGEKNGRVSQWFPVRDEHNRYSLQRVRGFQSQQGAIADIAVEERRKGFIAADVQGRVGVYHTTAERTLLVEDVSSGALVHLALAPRTDTFLAEAASGQLHVWQLHNEHPEVSWHSLWEKVQYEGYDEPRHIWQSSAASNDFEPKFSLTPLAFGTLKAAFYAMLFAVPLSIFGAIYAAYFMAPAMRQMVKPTIEIMEALPTVILGFLAGLWLAPTIESHLPGVFALLLFLPVGIILCALLWRAMPAAVRHRVPDGWEAALLIGPLIFFAWAAFALSTPLEHLLFSGDMRGWITREMGMDFDQRNALVVGIAMGFAVIPTIFSIAEDAIFSVPKHLTHGSLALGASPWQTLARVVILTASPGIFSAIMIGLGRAVGETMIVLMATGNTPVMDLSIFQGMRTLSANIAVEMPESEFNSTHYRVLFLAALVLFMFTFVFNTLAELIRQRLRRRYASL